MSLNIATILSCSAREFSDRPAVISGDRCLTYAALDREARCFASALRSLGVQRGQAVALLLPNVPEFTIAYFGCVYAGARVVPLNVLFKAEEIAYHLDDSDAVALVFAGLLAAEATVALDHVDDCRTAITVGGDGSTPELSELTNDSEPWSEIPDTGPEETAVVLYTSGTTGKPKGAELSHFNLLYNADVFRTRVTPLTEESVGLVALPLFHSFGQTVMQNAQLMAGACLVLMPRFDAAAAFDLMTRHGVTFFAGVPTMYFALLHSEEHHDTALPSLVQCVSGGAPMPVEVMTSFEKRFGVGVYEGYGLSETSPVATFGPRHMAKRPGSIGVPVWGVEMRLVDERGDVISEPDTPGEVCIKGHNVMTGYYNRPDATAAAIVDGWFSTGDIATVDADGFYYIVDRKKDMILRGGFNVYPREVEELLYRHADVIEAAVIGVADKRLGEEVKACVALRQGASATAEQLIAFCQEHLAAYKCPRSIDILPELPKGATGKILKRELRN